MDSAREAPRTIDEYIATFPEDVQAKLEEVRATIRAAAPEAEEQISYRMPTFVLGGGYLVHFAALKDSIGFYPTSSGVRAFEDELTAYKHTPGAIRFPLSEPLPLPLIRKIVEFRVAENLGRVTSKAKARKPPVPSRASGAKP